MKAINLLFTSAAILSSCQKETEDVAFPNIAEGTYHLEIFNDFGQRVLTREGNAIGLGNYSQVVIEDPKFGMQYGENQYDTFAALWLYTEKTYQEVWNKNPLWPVGDEASGALFVQRYYGGSSDWRYKSVSGEIRILDSTDTTLKGYFKIKMEVQKPDENNPAVEWTANPEWGNPITVKGYFISKGW